MHDSINRARAAYDISKLINNRPYRGHIRRLRQKKFDMRRRSFIAALTRVRDVAKVEAMTGVEIGVKFASLSDNLLTECPWIKRLMLVDPWVEFSADHPDREHHGYARLQAEGWDRILRLAMARLMKFGGRAVVARTTSVEAARDVKEIGERHFFVYLDGSHAYDDVLADCRSWWPNIVAGGCLTGDDYIPLDRRRGDQRDDVSKAVDDFAKEFGLPVVPLNRNFFIAKPL